MPTGFSPYVKNGLTPAERAERLAEVEAKIAAGNLPKRDMYNLKKQRWRLANPGAVKATRKRYYKAHPETVKAKARATQQRAKLEVFRHYCNGEPYCDCCGETEMDFLSVDHIGGGGSKHRREIGGAQALYSWLRRNGYPPGYRILCFNCNLAIGFFGTCPHQRKRHDNEDRKKPDRSGSGIDATSRVKA
jgi:hypothetical protein